MNLIRLLLLEAEGEEKPDLSDFEEDAISLHRYWLIEAKLASGVHSEYEDGTIEVAEISRLTWEGCEYLDAIRDQGVWNKLQKSFNGFKTSFTFPLLKDIAITIAKDTVLKQLAS